MAAVGSEAMARRLASRGLGVFRVPGRVLSLSLPENSEQFFRALGAGGMDKEAPVAVLSGYAPLLSGRMLASALKIHEADPSHVVASCRKASEHPCQLRALYKILHVSEMFPLVSGDGPQGDGWLRSAPFDYAWEQDLLRIAERAQEPRIPLESSCDRENAVRWLREGGLASFVFRGSYDRNFSPKYVGLDGRGQVPVVLLGTDGRNRTVLHLCDDAFPGAESLSVTLFGVTKQGMGRVVKAIGRNRPPVEVDTAELAGQIFFMVRQGIERGHYDDSDRFEPRDGYWSFEKRTMRPVLPSGGYIWGRQAFPQVFEMTEHVLVGTLAMLGQYEKLLLGGRVKGVNVQEEASLIVRSSFDLLRYSIFKDQGMGQRVRAKQDTINAA
ncbi:hypothetical protein [Pseudodesulfovibrio pelocollis]|uniref:hypothetical protein n=1 Tax=Pseudodesulfovibrio pelocollis TaxID=3051432 RepID=UPI00255AB9F9|nr:hypothetical protein [Pseudodesulfovibrio sp. SB368]